MCQTSQLRYFELKDARERQERERALAETMALPSDLAQAVEQLRGDERLRGNLTDDYARFWLDVCEWYLGEIAAHNGNVGAAYRVCEDLMRGLNAAVGAVGGVR